MAASSRTLLIATAAFASGVAGTIAFTLPRSHEAPAASQEAASRPRADASAAARAWSEPTKSPAASTAPVEKPPERLVFHKDDAPGPAADRSDTAGGAPTPRADRVPASKGAPTESGDADGSHAQIEQTGDRRPKPAAIPARPQPRPAVAKTAPAPAPAQAPAGRPSQAVVAQARIPVLPRDRGVDSRRSEERPSILAMKRDRLPDPPAAEPRRRFSSADAGGVMKWLAEPTRGN